MSIRMWLAGLALFPALAGADTIVFKNGSRMDGLTAVRGDVLEVRVPEGSFYFARSLVASIATAATPLAEFERRRAGLPAKDAKAAFELGVFCEANGLKAQATEMFRRTAALDPSHADAHTRLGHRQVSGRWLSREELLADLGMVQVDGEWMSPRTARQLADLDERTRKLDARLAQMEIESTKLQTALERSQRDTDADRRIAQLEGELRGLRATASQAPVVYPTYYGYTSPYTIVSPRVYDGRPRQTAQPYPPRVGRLPLDPLPFPGIPPIGSPR